MKVEKPPDYTFFTDRDLGNIVPDAIVDAGLRVERHDDYFDEVEEDPTWLRKCGEEDWVALSHNANIRRVERQRNMVMRAGVRLFILIGHHTHDRLANNFIHSIYKVEQFLHKYSRYGDPFIARVYMAPEHRFERGKGGKVNKWLLYDEWKREQGIE